jgi:hypothetical protein
MGADQSRLEIDFYLSLEEAALNCVALALNPPDRQIA